jgi:glucosamine--fructose-6-phosphate aminotransferase (isomerizing)
MNEEFIPIEIHDTPLAIRDTVTQARPAAEQIAAAMREQAPGRIFLIGNGTSLYSSLAASYTARALAVTGDPLVVPMPAGDFRYFTPALAKNDIVVGMSASGEFRDVLAVFERLRGKNLCIGVTQVPGSSLTDLADFSLFAGGGSSNVPVMTKTYASTLTAVHALLLAFYQASEAYWQDLLASASRCQSGIEALEQLLPEIVPAIQHFEHAFHFGAGCGYAAALETSLKMKEMAMVHAEGAETWEMASGPAIITGPQTLCVALGTGGAGDASTLQGAAATYSWGVTLITFGLPAIPKGKATAPAWHIPVTAPTYECFASLSLVPPAALLAYRLARARGYDPNRPDWRERYHSQGMTHILGE